MKANFLCWSSVFLVFSAILIEWSIFTRFVESSGKTQALFGIVLALSCWYRHTIAFLGLVTAVLSWKHLSGKVRNIVIGISAISSLIIWMEAWRLFL